MRVLMSLAGLLLVLLLVSKLAGTQLQALGPGASASAATGTALQSLHILQTPQAPRPPV